MNALAFLSYMKGIPFNDLLETPEPVLELYFQWMNEEIEARRK